MPADVTDALRTILPASAQIRLGVTDGSWVAELCGLLDQVRAELTHDVATFEERRREAFGSRRSDLAARFERSINTIRAIGCWASGIYTKSIGFSVAF